MVGYSCRMLQLTILSARPLGFHLKNQREQMISHQEIEVFFRNVLCRFHSIKPLNIEGPHLKCISEGIASQPITLNLVVNLINIRTGSLNLLLNHYF
jgi:hypothetical protein